MSNSENEMLMYIISFILGYLLARMWRLDSFSPEVVMSTALSDRIMRDVVSVILLVIQLTLWLYPLQLPDFLLLVHSVIHVLDINLDILIRSICILI